MAEIKSTLDLVLERTKNLNITAEERKTLKRRETAGKIKGIVQRYLDGILDLNSVIQELNSLDAIGTIREILAADCIERIDPMGDSGKIYELLEKFFSNKEALRGLADQWKRSVLEEKRTRAAEAAEKLKEKQISGSALIPNAEKDPAWKSRYIKLLAQFRKEAASRLNLPDQAVR